MKLTKLLAGLRAKNIGPFPDFSGHSPLKEHQDFGSNPGRLRMLTFSPKKLEKAAPLVVVLHGCTQTASGYGQGAGWLELAEDFGFSLLLPEQQRANNPNGCFNWFLSEDMRRGNGEAFSIAQMIDRLIRDEVADPTRVFITGLSAGGAMAAVMLATYPEKFAAGAVIAGLPYGSATNVPEALKAMAHAQQRSGRAWGDLVRKQSSYSGAWPRVSVWHGSADKTVAPSNGLALVSQWLDVHGLAGQKPETSRISGFSHLVWRRDGAPLVEEYVISGMGHGTPLHLQAENFPHGAAGPFLLDVGIASSLHIARFFGIASLPAGAQRRKTVRNDRQVTSPGTMLGVGDVQSIIDKALKSAGLLK